jgi:hypothetical protein
VAYRKQTALRRLLSGVAETGMVGLVRSVFALGRT